MFDRYTENTYERVKTWFAGYLGKEPEDNKFLRVLYMFYSKSDPDEAIYNLYLHTGTGKSVLTGRTMKKLYKRFERLEQESLIQQKRN